VQSSVLKENTEEKNSKKVVIADDEIFDKIQINKGSKELEIETYLDIHYKFTEKLIASKSHFEAERNIYV